MPKKTIKKPKPALKQKRRYDVISTGSRGVIQNIIYRVPKKKNILKTLNDIQEYVNIKSRQMATVKGLKDSTVSVAIKFDSGKYISTSYMSVGKNLDIGDVYEDYNDDEGGYGRSIQEFTIQFIPKI